MNQPLMVVATKDKDRRLTAEERHGGVKFPVRFTEEWITMRRRVADIVPVAVEQVFDIQRRYMGLAD
ncbi:hypothetical protein F2Q70_00003856 [Brassica cretica]|uniref:Uncharacterized protein n=1 Tax=Brassica cretica TaxID=69181 RepID=A0A8S9IZD4_BRACR|nr:hypothetical protein F2Q70_00003856 [Brassica cretica]